LSSLTTSPDGIHSHGDLFSGDVHRIIRFPLNQQVYPFDQAIPATDANGNPVVLTVTISGAFAESLKPKDVNGVPLNVKPSGFVNGGGTGNDLLTASTATAGTAALNGVMSNASDLVGAASSVFTGNQSSLNASWNINGVQTHGDDPWTIAVKPIAFDRAKNPSMVLDGTGKPVSMPNALKVWWMYRVAAKFAGNSTGYGMQTSTPHFEWTLLPATRPPADTNYFGPATLFKVWYWPANNSGWTPLTLDWSLTDQPIDRFTLLDTGVFLGNVLDQSDVKGKQLLIALRGRDEAGNIQPEITNNPAQFNAAGIDYRIWVNETNQGNVAVDTDLNVQLAHVDANGNVVPGHYFGSVARVPLPLKAESGRGVIVQAAVTMNARVPSVATEVTINWKLYEEGTLVAQGAVSSDSGSFALPSALYTRHLGDEVARQREIHYTLSAQTVAGIPVGGVDAYGRPLAQPIPDPTPASVEFSIYVPEVMGQVREEQPVRIYERK